MRSEIFKFFLGVALMLVVSALLAFNALIIWVAIAPRSLSALTPYIEEALVSPNGNFHVAIGDTMLFWDGWEHPIDIRLMDVSVITKENELFTKLPEISLGVDILSLPFGRVVPTNLIIKSPVVNLVQNVDHSISIGFEKKAEAEVAPSVPFSAMLAPLFSTDADSNFNKIKKVEVRGAKISVSNQKIGMFFDANPVNIMMLRNKKGELKINTSSDIFYKDYTSNINSEFAIIPSEKKIYGGISFSALMPDILAALFTSDKDLKSLALPVSGIVHFDMDMEGTVQKLSFEILGGKGAIQNAKLASPIKIDSIQAKGEFGAEFNELELHNFAIKTEDEMEISSVGKISGLNDKPEINLEVALKGVQAKNIKNYWPASLAPLSREWVVENITEGTVPSGKAIIAIKAGDLDKPLLPKEAVDANLELKNLKIRYLPEHPVVTDVMGSIHIDAVSLNANIDRANYLKDTKLSGGHVIIDDLNADNPYIKVDLNADAPASDIVHFLGLPRLDHAEHLGLSEKEAGGRVKGSAEVGFNFFAPKGKKAEEAIKYSVKADAIGVSQPKFLGKFVLKNINGSASVDNKGIVFNSSGGADSSVGKGTVKYSFEPQDGFDTFIDVDSADLTETMEKSDGGFSFQNFPVLAIKAKVDKLVMGKDNIISGLAGHLQCSRSLCNSVDISGKTGGKPFSAKIFSTPQEGRKISVSAEDAGSFLRAIGVFYGMNDGVLTLRGNYKEAASGSTLTGEVRISEHTVKDAPILGRMLALASLTGFIDSLQGNGIRFDKSFVPFTLSNDVITLSKAKCHGSAIGLTADGTITFPQKTLDLHGTIVPSYTLNNVVGKVPLLGDMLTGGDGQGVFAARYTMKGTTQNPDITVNPLSILTPGFLRGLFDVFDEDEKKP